MKPADILRAITYPVTESSVLVPLVAFWLLISLANWGGLFGLIFLFLLVIPALYRFQMIVLEARARGCTPATPDLGFFSWFGNAWTLFPVFVVVLLVWAIVAIGQGFGTSWAILAVFIAAVFFPASIAVLAITHSPLQSLNPVALGRLLHRCSATIWIASVFLLISSWLSAEAEALPRIGSSLVQLLLSFSFFSLVGSLIEPYGLIEEIDIPAPTEKDGAEIAHDLEKNRVGVLNHAYGFISRGNREGGFEHIFDWMTNDPDPVAAWAWFFDRMLAWENKSTAMFFAQHYLHDLLRHDEKVPAVKLLMRCRLVDGQFRPLTGDVAAAVAASEACGNAELAAILTRS